ncbi:LicD family protein [Photobacterium piscicola]|uniref:LicD family protein n=1 Tax=Photobacterium piscicola TaxID=1378299 RepID=UPI002E182EE9|nr:LicD family protein [Photobacterium piscicola]
MILSSDKRKAQLKMLQGLVEFDSICKEYNLLYWLDWGTLLGAKRHQGFIPWDDDIDVAMPRRDFEKLIMLSDTIFNDNIFIQCLRSDKNYSKRTIPCKIRIKNTFVVEKEDITCGIDGDMSFNRGLFIDVFPMDKYSKNSIVRRFERLFSIIYYLKTISQYVKNKDRLRHVISRPFKLIPFSSLEWLKKQIIKKCTNYSKDEYVFGYGVEIPNCNQVFDKKTIYPIKKMYFEGQEFNVPNNIHAYLIALYGESYMQLPPENERISHIVKLEL